MVDSQQCKGLNQLGLNGRSPDRHHGLPGKDRRSLRNRPNVPGEAEVLQIVQKGLGEQPLAPQELDILFIKVKVLNIVDQLIQTGTDGKAALVWHLPEEYIEISDPVF